MCATTVTGSIYAQPKESIEERKLYEKLKALNKYQKRHDVEAIMYKKYLEKRQKVCWLFVVNIAECGV